MRRWPAVLALLAVAALVAASSSLATPPPNPKICPDFAAIMERAFHTTVPPSTGTSTGLGGLPAVVCTFGPVSITDMRATIQDWLLNAPKSGTPDKTKCSKSLSFSGTNTIATTNAATNKTTMKTVEDFNFLCFDYAPHAQLIRITENVKRLTPGFEKTFLNGAASVAASAAFRDIPPPP